MNWFDRAALLATGLTAIYMIWRFYGDVKDGLRPSKASTYYVAAFAVLLVSGLLLIGLGYSVLENRLVVVAASVIPLTLSLGLVSQYFPRRETAYTWFAVIGFLALTATRFVGPKGLALTVLILVHAVAGLMIFILPLVIAFSSHQAPAGIAWVGVGGALIGIGGIALAFLKVGMPILPASFIFAILAPLLLLMTASFTYGFLRGLPR